MSEPTVEELLSESSLTTGEHRVRNWVAALGVAASAFLLPIALHMGISLDRFVSVVVAQASAGSFVEQMRAQFPSGLPAKELRFVGWLVLPGIFFWFGVARDRSTDGKLKSTERIHLDHLEYEAATAKAKMLKQNLTLTEAEEIFAIVRGLGFKMYIARKQFAARRHEIVTASLTPWILAVIGLFVATVPLYQAVAWDNLGAFIAGAIVTIAAATYKARRYAKFSDFWAAYDVRRFTQPQ